MPNDWEVINVYASTSPKSWQTKTVITIKFLRRARNKPPADGGSGGDDGDKGESESESEEQEIYGKRYLVNDVIKENLGGRTEIIHECKTEGDRVAALEKYFGLWLTEEEQSAIQGWRTQLAS
ncbi:hypothetical protein NPX13_g9615 [Xylaria arbuscula]|uniref:Uncharacterized protein n=1 Tax=Xylaria arbuscula TaxID=114810 RepID=A0A9W8N6A1_9PEZI|nr:hypothetical protein NPX13_g9615 [Xylaria arbuscula]